MNTIDAKEVIDPRKFEQYDNERKAISELMMYAYNNLIVIEKIVNFPFYLFARHDINFWSLTSKAYFDSTVVTFATLLGVDGSNRSHRLSIEELRRRLFEEYILEEYRPTVQEVLASEIAEINFDSKIALLRRKIREVRNNHVAHHDFALRINPENGDQIPYWISYIDLREGLSVCEQFFDILCLKHKFDLALWDYAPRPEAKSYFIDLDKLLAFVASQSWFFSDDPDLGDTLETRIAELPEQDQQMVREWQQKIMDMNI